MNITNPEAEFLLALIERLKSKAPSIRSIEADLGQMENYPQGGRPPLSFPAVIFDIDDTAYDQTGELTQIGESVLVVRICQPSYSGSINSIHPDEINLKAVDYLNTEQEVFLALQGFSFGYASTMIRVSKKLEKRNDEYRVKTMRFSFGVEDNTANRPLSIARPDFSVNITKP